MLEQQGSDNAGSASSLIGFSYNLFGITGMILISQDWANRVIVIGIINIFCALISLALWLVFSKRFGFYNGKSIREEEIMNGSKLKIQL